MLRCGLVNYLLFVLAAGPWYCCCTVNQIADRLASMAVRNNERTSSPSCCHCRQPSSDEDSRQNSSEEPAPSEPTQCPCQETRAEFVDNLCPGVDNSRFSQLDPRLQIDIVVADMLDLRTTTTTQDTSPSRDDLTSFRICSSQRLLILLQIFRC